MSIKIFIGSSSNNEDSPIECIYEYTLRKNSSKDLDITWMRQTADISSLWGGWNSSQWFTPFSGFRWAIPEACKFQGRALYTDVDMINFRDIGELFQSDLHGKPFGARILNKKDIELPAFNFNNLKKLKNPFKVKRFSGFQPCVMLIDCEQAKQFLDPVSLQKTNKDIHNKYMKSFLNNSFFKGLNYFSEIDSRWNCLDGEDLPIDEIFQLHFTNMSTQPWKPEWFKGSQHTHPRADIINLFNELLEEASENGFQPKQNSQARFEYKIIGS